MKRKIVFKIVFYMSLIIVVILTSCRKDVSIQLQGNNNTSSTSQTSNYIVNGSFENGLNGWNIENVYFMCDSPYVYTRPYSKVPPGGGNNICVMIYGTDQGFCWAYYPQLTQKITGKSGNQLHLSFWSQQTCTKIGSYDMTHQVMDSITMATQYPYCISSLLSNFYPLKVYLKKNNTKICSLYCNVPNYVWKKYDTVFNVTYSPSDTLKLVFFPPIFTWPTKCFLLDMVELKNR